MTDDRETAKHEWIPSNLGHGETMCANCFMTNREAVVLNQLEYCLVAAVRGEGRDG